VSEVTEESNRADGVLRCAWPLLALLAVVAAGTGVWLVADEPMAAQTWDDVYDLTSQANRFDLVRNLHAWSARLIALGALGLVVFAGATRRARSAARLGLVVFGAALALAAVAVAPESGTGNQLSHTLAVAGHAMLGPIGLALIAIGLWPPKRTSEEPSPTS